MKMPLRPSPSPATLPALVAYATIDPGGWLATTLKPLWPDLAQLNGLSLHASSTTMFSRLPAACIVSKTACADIERVRRNTSEAIFAPAGIVFFALFRTVPAKKNPQSRQSDSLCAHDSLSSTPHRHR